MPGKPITRTYNAPVSWGDRMPDQENMFNYQGSYVQYFDEVFDVYRRRYRVIHEFYKDYYDRGVFDRENPLCISVKDAASFREGAVFWFMDGDRPVLAVEIKHEKCAMDRLRNACSKAHIPYIRFYYNHHGWWNTKDYVLYKVDQALIGR